MNQIIQKHNTQEMNRLSRIFVIFLILCQLLPPTALFAQTEYFTITGTIKDAFGAPIELANVTLDRTLGTYSKRDGSFSIPRVPRGTYQWRVTYVGFETASGTIKIETGRERLNVRLKELSLGLEQVTVTAKQQQMGSSSLIDQEAIRHLQPKSLGDLLQLVPGNLTENPNLNTLSQAQIREIGTNAANAMGTSIVIDGTPLSNDANLELMSFSKYGTSADGNGGNVGANSTAGRGVDLRTISAGVVEDMEVIRGIPSAEYGNLTSGVVIVNTKSGYTPWEAKLQADPNSKLAFVGKGFRLNHGGALNVSLDWAQSWADTRLHYKGYDRVTATVGYSNQFGPLSFNVRGAFFTSINNTKRDPQMSESYSEWKNNNTGGRLSINGQYKRDHMLFSSVDYKLSAQLSRQHDWMSNWIYNPDGVITNTREDGLQLARFKRYGYSSEYEIESIPINIYSQLVANKYFRFNDKNYSTLKIGADFTYDGNQGKGFTYDEDNPPQAMSSHRLRPRAYSDIPGLATLSGFIADRSSLTFGSMKGMLEAGVRLSNLFLNSEKSGGNKGYFVAEPRLNASLTLLNKDNNRILDDLTLTGGYGISNKMPPLLYLYPDASYHDNVAMSRWSNNEANRMALITTTVVRNTQNPDLKPVHTQKWEVGLSFSKWNIQGSLTYFNERHENELSSTPQMLYINYPYFSLPDGATDLVFNPATQDVTYQLAGAPGVATKNIYTERQSWGRPSNSGRSLKHGIEYTLTFPEFKPLRTSLNVTGAWFHIKRQDMDLGYANITYDNRVQTSSPYAVVLPAGSGSIKTRFNSNFAFVTHIPELKMVFTTTLQVVWRETDQDIYEDENGNTRYYLKSYSDKDYMVVTPVGYYDLNGNYSAWQPADADNGQLNIYMGRAQPYSLLEDIITPWAMLNLRLTKELGRTGEISFTANNLTNSRRYRKNENSNAIYQVFPGMYFGAEVKLRF